jgi:hypothetical protein
VFEGGEVKFRDEKRGGVMRDFDEEGGRVV